MMQIDSLVDWMVQCWSRAVPQVAFFNHSMAHLVLIH